MNSINQKFIIAMLKITVIAEARIEAIIKPVLAVPISQRFGHENFQKQSV